MRPDLRPRPLLLELAACGGATTDSAGTGGSTSDDQLVIIGRGNDSTLDVLAIP